VRHHIFEIPDDQAAHLVPAIDAGSFPWSKLVPGLLRDVDRDHIPVRFSDLSRYGARAAGEHQHDHDHSEVHVLGTVLTAVETTSNKVRLRVLGLFWTDYRIECDQSLRNDPTLLAEVMWSEGAHAIDQAMLNDAQRAEIVAALHPEGPDEHPPWWERSDYSAEYGVLPGESFMEIVVEAYTPLTATINLHHAVTPHVIEVARRILTPELVEPAVAPFFGLVRAKVFHDTHEGVAREIEWDAYEQAIADGRRPCRVCRPKEA
jgi:hypothetical protein